LFALTACGDSEIIVSPPPESEISAPSAADSEGTPPAETAKPSATLAEFIAAIAPGATVTVPEGGLTLTVTESDLQGIDPAAENPYIRWDGFNGVWNLTIHDVSGLTISGENSAGNLLSEDADAWVLNFENCDDLTLSGITAGHNVEGFCEGGAVRIEDSRRVTLDGVRMYGCGTEGIRLSNAEDATIRNSEIYECTYYLMTIQNSENVRFEDCVFRDTGEYDLVTVSDSNNISFERCAFRGNRVNPGFGLFTAADSWAVSVNDCEITGNDADALDTSGLVDFFDCVMEDNTFNLYPERVANNGGRYVKRDGAVYFRDYAEDAGDVPYTLPGETTSVMRRLNADGAVSAVFADNGSGGIFIYDNGADAFFILNREAGLGEDEDAAGIYGVTLSGDQFWQIGQGNAFAVDSERGVIIAATERGGLSAIDVFTHEATPLLESLCIPLAYDPEDGMVYYSDFTGEEETLCSVELSGGWRSTLLKASEVAGVLEDASAGSIEYKSPRFTANSVWVYAAYYEGNLGYLGDSALLEIQKDGSGFRVEPNPRVSDWFGVGKPFSAWSESPFRGVVGGDTEESATGYYLADAEGMLTEILTESDLAEVGLAEGEYYGEEDYAVLKDMEFVDGALFFTVETGTRNREEDIGWRYGYLREISSVYRKDLTGGVISPICSY
jgi:hypothetical protein